MSEVKTFEELKEELGEDYDKKLYEMGVSAMNEITRLNNIIDELKQEIRTLKIINRMYEVDRRIDGDIKKLKEGVNNENNNI